MKNEFSRSSILYGRLFFFILLFTNILMLSRVAFFGKYFQVGLYSYLVYVPSLFILFFYFFKKNNVINFRYDHGLLSFLLYVIFQVLSISFYLLNDVTFDNLIKSGMPFLYLIINCVVFILLPQLTFFLFGFILTDGGLTTFRRLSTLFLLIGLFLFYFKPFNYQDYLNSLYGSGQSYLNNLRFLGTLDNSMAMGSLALSVTILYLFSKSITSKIEKALILVPIFSVLVSFQRSAIVMLLFVLVIYFVMSIAKPTYIKVLVTLSLAILFIFFIITSNYTFTEFAVVDRLKTISSGFARLISLEQIYGVSSTLLVGLGLGVSSHKGELWSSINFFDNNYFRVLADLGLLGFVSFFILLCSNIISAFKFNEFCYLFIIFVFSIQALFTNVFDLFYSSFVFWLVIGHLSSISINRREQ